MRITTPVRLGAVALAASLTLVACGSGDDGDAAGGGETKTLRLALNQTEQHPSFVALDNFGKRLEEATDGRLGIQVYPNATLGAQQEALQLVSDGTVDLAIVSGTQLENLNKDFSVFNLPLVFDSIESQMKTIHDPAVVGDLYSSLEANNKVTVVGGFTQGTRNVYSKKGPVNTPADLSGQKIRVQESELHTSMISAMGASATPMEFGEVYTALQSGVLDGAENNEVSYVTQKHYEVAKFYSRTNHLVGLDFLIVNSDLLKGFSAEDKAAFDKEWAAAYAEHTDLWAKDTEKSIATAEAAGAKFNEVDAAAFEAVLKPLTDKFLTSDAQRKIYDAAQSAGS
ncbi:C4-dicarboxylate ABC transporter [Knoellia sinensis KCTC 19936]|uniref:C4-dicarboxylate ABC transporter n=1 Tax=Knoellia sinensis KCTC 19936 TaxID=1385520 RepID=A0A0A0J2V7_9MICO|nr:TRAP transporter substrate-binding protein [Knoellia sinensis]KGN31473.1 C4-dicarboxylate ABC transporter [Knoellia sinensis KCTC 19936]